MKKPFSDGEELSNHRKNMFIASGGTDRSISSLNTRLDDALAHSGGEYLDAFVIEYVCPYELTPDNQMGEELERAIEHVHAMKRSGKVRYVVASTHSHAVGSGLASAAIGGAAAFDALMLRYNMSHRNAAEAISLPKARENGIPVLAFTTTRWNRLQSDPPFATEYCPNTADCIKFGLQNEQIEVVLHSARDENELDEALLPLFASAGQPNWLSKEENERWRAYGNDEGLWNEDDSFDEYPDESI